MLRFLFSFTLLHELIFILRTVFGEQGKLTHFLFHGGLIGRYIVDNKIGHIYTVEEPWMSQMDKKLFALSDQFAHKYYKVLYSNHREAMKTFPTVEDRLSNLSDNFYRLLARVDFILRYLESKSDKRIPSFPIEKKLIKEFYDYFLHPKNGWQQIGHERNDNQYQYVRWNNLDADFRNKLKLYYKDITNIIISYILFETGGYIDKRAAQQMEWIEK